VSRFVRDSLHTLSFSMINRVLSILVGIVMARALGPVGKGEIAYAMMALGFFVVAIGGLTQAVTYQYGRNGVPGGAVYAAMIRILGVLSAVSMIALTAVALYVPSQLVLLWVVPAIPFALYGEATIGLLLGAEQIAATNVQRVFANAGFNFAAIVALAVFHAPAEVVLELWIAGYVAGALYAAHAVRPFVREGRVDRPIVEEQARFAAKSGLATGAGYVNMRVNVVVVSLLLGPAALGVYTLAIGLGELLWQFSQPLCWAGFGRMATAPFDESAAFTAKVTRHVIALLVPLAIVAFVAAPRLVTLVYGEAFAGAGSALRWLLPGIVAYSIEAPLGYFLLVKLGRPMLIVAIQSASSIACIAVTLLTVRTWGIDGAALASSVTYISVVAAKAWIFCRATGVPAAKLFAIDADDLRGAPFARRFLGARG
jgi:O-antigen/teichoic acid export membrane protein